MGLVSLRYHTIECSLLILGYDTKPPRETPVHAGLRLLLRIPIFHRISLFAKRIYHLFSLTPFNNPRLGGTHPRSKKTMMGFLHCFVRLCLCIYSAIAKWSSSSVEYNVPSADNISTIRRTSCSGTFDICWKHPRISQPLSPTVIAHRFGR